MSDKEEIVRALTLWFQPGDVFEIRALGATTGMNTRPHTESGYFDFEHAAEAADAIGKIRSADGVYVTINPVKRDLLARAVYKLRFGKDLQTTADGNIVRRRWMLVDCDPVRESGIASTDAEHDLAIGKAKEIRDGLASLGWPTPILSDSGNGAHLFYRVDLPADDGGLVQNALAVLHSASDEHVEVDVSVFNPARIVRVPGTMNRKGDDADGKVCGRPHRMAKILEVPETISVVTEEQLKALVGSKPVAPAPATVDDKIYYESGDFSIDEWIAKFAPDAGSPIPYRNNGVSGRKWIFKVCPFNPDHNNSAAAILAFDGGGYTFKCLHNGCAGNDWKKFRVLREPGCYDRKPETYPDVDISGILNGNGKSAAANVPDSTSDVVLTLKPFPPELYRVPGFVHDVMKFCLDTAPSPQPELAFACALALQGHLAGRKVECMNGIRTNTYIIMLAPSGSGKNHPRRIIRKVLSRIGLGDEVFEDTSSGQGIEDYLIAKPRLLWLSDEIYEMLQAVINDKSGAKEKIMKMLLTLHTSAADEYTTRAKAGASGTLINCPHLTLFGACTPEGFFNSINDHIIGHGLFGRMELIFCDNQPEPRIPGCINTIPAEIEHHALQWKNYFPSGSGNIELHARSVEGAPEVMAMLREYQLEAHRENMKLKKSGAPEWQQTLWNRVFESIVRFALIYACSEAESPEKATLSAEGVKWAHDLALWGIENKITMVRKYYYRTDFERNSEQVVTMMQHWHDSKGWNTPMPGWLFNRKTKELSPKVKDAVVQSLRAQERLEVTSTQTQGRASLTYRLCH